MSLLVEPIWSWPWIVLAGIATLAAVLTTYRRRIAHLSPGTRRSLLGLRLFTWAILLFALLQPAIEFKQVNPQSTILFLAADASRSMGIKDGPAGLSRREAVLKMVADAQSQIQTLRKTIELKYLDFADDVTPVEEFRLDSVGQQTAIGRLLDRIPELAEGKRIGGVFIASDFAQRALPPNDIDPRASANRLAEQQVRIDTIGFGASGLTDTSLDLIVEDLDISPTVFVKNTVVAGARIRALGADGRDVTVRLLIEDLQRKEPGRPAPMVAAAPPKVIRPTRSQEVLPVELTFNVDTPGEFKITLEVQPLEGEPITVNNSLTTFLTVLKGGISVAYFDREHRAEMKFLRRIDESPDIRLDLKPIRMGMLGGKQNIEEEWFLPGKYDVYIIGSVPARVFGQKNLDRLAEAVEQGAGLIMTGGTFSFGPGGYADTALANVLPVQMLRTEIQNGEDVDPTLHYDQMLQMIPTPEGIQHFVMRLDTPEKNLERWKALPALDKANRFHGLKRGAQKLAVSAEGQHPLLVAQDYGRGRSMAFAADTTYLWWLNNFSEAHQRFWQQVILWLAHKDQQGDESVWVKLDTRRFRAGQPVPFTFGARDVNKRPIDDAEFKVKVFGPDNREVSLTPQRAGAEHGARFVDTRPAGEYRIQVEASREGETIGLPAEARFIVYEQDLELHNPAADFVLMEELVRISGGTNIPPEAFGGYLHKLLEQDLSLDVTEIQRVSLWDNWVLLMLFVAAMTTEWYVRKRRGLV